MDIVKNEHFISFNSADRNGKFSVQVQYDASQLRLNTADNDAYVDLDLNELKSIRNCIEEVILKHHNTEPPELLLMNLLNAIDTYNQNENTGSIDVNENSPEHIKNYCDAYTAAKKFIEENTWS